jgi:chromosome partitioning protein
MKKIVVAFVAQKGGVGKSTLARAFATMASKEGYVVRLIDLDVQQMTTLHWHEQRVKNGYKPIGTVEAVAKVSQAIEQAGDFDFLIFDGSARASQGTLEIAKIADLVVIPTCASRDDLFPAVKLAHEFQENGVHKEAIVLCLTRVSTESETEDARIFIQNSGNLAVHGQLLEKAGYRQAQNEGLSIFETRFSSLNTKAKELLNSITNHLS